MTDTEERYIRWRDGLPPKMPAGNENCACRVEGANFVFCPLHGAAPEMLTALQEARNVILLAFDNGAWNDESSDDQDSKDEVLTVLAGMEDAIAKAEGRG